MGLCALSGRTALPAPQRDSILEAQEFAQSSASTSSPPPLLELKGRGEGSSSNYLVCW